MDDKEKRRRHFTVLLSIISLMCLGVADVEAGDGNWQVRFNLVDLDPDLAYRATTDDGDPLDVRADSDTGFQLGIEYRFARKGGLELAWVSATPTVTIAGNLQSAGVEISAKDRLGFEALTAAINMHFTPDSLIDFYVSPKIAYISYGDPTFSLEVPGLGTETLELVVDADVAWGFGAGFDVRLGDSAWFANGFLNYLISKADFKQRGDQQSIGIDFDPMIIGVGIGYRF